ncbi:hypothetical protein M5689_021355 [Euphorbia peplus]|nr:hypothetical protein M5689_021355 [Euphorbia peplus]
MQTIASAEETLARVDSLMIDDILTSYLRDELRQLLKFLSDNPHLFPAALDRHTKSQSIPPKFWVECCDL